MEIKIEPEWPLTEIAQALVREAQMLQRLERVPEAIEAYKRVLARWPDLADCWFNLGVLHRKHGQLQEALDSYQKSLDLGIASPEEVHLNRAVIYSDYLRREGLAERELNRALTLNPNYTPALLNLANLNEDLGRRDEAGALYQRLLALDPHCHEALARYANLQPVADIPQGLIAQLESARLGATTAADQASIGFALGRLLDAKGRYADSFAAYTAANRANRASVAAGAAAYDRKRQEQLIDMLIHSPVAAAASGSKADPQPIFICGLFRSGSTLTEQLLAAHPGVRAGGELNLLPRLAATLGPLPRSLTSASADVLTLLAAQYRRELEQLFPGATHVTDKRPDNFLWIGLIKALFPSSRIVHTTRAALDNCLSIFFLHLDPRVGYAHELLDIGHYFREYRRLMAHWKSCFGNDLYEFNYDAFVGEPGAQAARLFEFLGLKWDDRYLEARSIGHAVKTASVWQVREPIYSRSSGRAANYARQLEELRAYLSDLLPADVMSAS